MPFFYASANRQPVGPLSRAQLDDLARQGTVTPDTLVVEEGATAWQPYRSLTGARPATTVLPPPPSMASAPLTMARPPAPTTAPAAMPVTAGLGHRILAACTAPQDVGQRLIAIGGIAGVVGFLMPWGHTDPRSSVSGWTLATGQSGITPLLVLPLCSLAAVVVAGLVHGATTPQVIRLARIPLAAGAATAALVGLGAVMAESIANQLSGFTKISIGFGVWLTVLASAAQAVGAWMMIGNRRLG